MSELQRDASNRRLASVVCEDMTRTCSRGTRACRPLKQGGAKKPGKRFPHDWRIADPQVFGKAFALGLAGRFPPEVYASGRGTGLLIPWPNRLW